MKKALYLASACLLAIAFSSCEKELENPRKGANDFNTFYTNAIGNHQAHGAVALLRLTDGGLVGL